MADLRGRIQEILSGSIRLPAHSRTHFAVFDDESGTGGWGPERSGSS